MNTAYQSHINTSNINTKENKQIIFKPQIKTTNAITADKYIYGCIQSEAGKGITKIPFIEMFGPS